MTELKHIDLVNAYFRARDEKDTNDEIKFECPLCHGIARGATAENGHIRVACQICGIKIVE